MIVSHDLKSPLYVAGSIASIAAIAGIRFQWKTRSERAAKKADRAERREREIQETAERAEQERVAALRRDLDLIRRAVVAELLARPEGDRFFKITDGEGSRAISRIYRLDADELSCVWSLMGRKGGWTWNPGEVPYPSEYTSEARARSQAVENLEETARRSLRLERLLVARHFPGERLSEPL